MKYNYLKKTCLIQKHSDCIRYYKYDNKLAEFIIYISPVLHFILVVQVKLNTCVINRCMFNDFVFLLLLECHPKMTESPTICVNAKSKTSLRDSIRRPPTHHFKGVRI